MGTGRMAKLQELQEKRQQLAAQIKELAERQSTWTSEDEGQWQKVNGEYDANAAEMKAETERLQKSEDVQKRLAEIEREWRDRNSDRRIGVDEHDRRNANPENIQKRAEEDSAQAMQAWLRGGVDLTKRQSEACDRLRFRPTRREFDANISARYGDPAWSNCGQRRIERDYESRVGLDVATSGAGLETIPEGFLNQLEMKLLAFGGPRNVARVIRTATGNSLPMPVVDDTSNTGEKLAEATSFGTSVDPTFSAVTLNAYKYSSKPVFVSQELLEDSAFNLAAEIGGMLGTRLGRIMGSADTTGDGSGDPNGIVTAATTSTAAGSTSFTAEELIDLVHALDPAYRSNPSVGFMMNDAIVKYVRKFKDANGQFLWQPGMQSGIPDRLYGYPVAINQHMASALTTGQKLVLFADFEKYVIRDVAQLRFYRLDERYRDLDQTAFIAFMRHDADALVAAAIRLLVLA